MRRLPIFFVIDISESMIGTPIKKVEEGMRTIIGELKRDPYALETVHISIIVFSSVAKTLLPLTDIIAFYPPELPIGSGTGYGEAIDHLRREIELQVRKSTPTEKGDWKPIVYFLTDGNPTDEYEPALKYWEQKYKNKTNIVVISLGDNADQRLLNRISDNVLAFDDSDAESYKAFFKWVTSSIKTQSQKVETNPGDETMDLGGFDKAKLRKAGESASGQQAAVDDRYAIFHGKCQKTHGEYLIKYVKGQETTSFGGFSMPVRGYNLQGAYKLNKSYYEFSNNQYKIDQKISTEELKGFTSCPCCGNQFSLAICMCGNIFCLDGAGVHTCPWCKTQAQYGRGSGHIDINRREG